MAMGASRDVSDTDALRTVRGELFAGLYDDGPGWGFAAARATRVRLLNPAHQPADDSMSRRFSMLEID